MFVSYKKLLKRTSKLIWSDERDGSVWGSEHTKTFFPGIKEKKKESIKWKTLNYPEERTSR